MSVFSLLPLLMIPAAPPLAGEEPIPAGAIARLGTTRFRAEQPISEAFYTPDGNTLIGCTASAVYLWNSDTGVLQRKIEISDSSPAGPSRPSALGRNRFALHPKGRILACDGVREGQRELQYWDISTGIKVFSAPIARAGRTPFPISRGSQRMEWTPDGTRLIQSSTSSTGSRITMTDERGKTITVENTWFEPLIGTRFSVFDDRRMLVYALNEKPRLVDIATGRTDLEFDIIFKQGDTGPTISPKLDMIAFNPARGVHLYRVADGKLEKESLKGDSSNSITGFRTFFSPDGKILYFTNNFESVDLDLSAYDLAADKRAFALRLENTGWQSWAAVSPDGRRACALGRGAYTLHPVDAKTGSEVQPPPGHVRPPLLKWLPDNRTLLARARSERSWSVWNTTTGRRERLFGPGRGDVRQHFWTPNFPVALSPDGQNLVDPNEAFNGGVAVRNLLTGRIEKNLLAAEEQFELGSMSFAFPADGRHILLYSDPTDSDSPYNRCNFAVRNLSTNREERTFSIAIPFGYKIAPSGPHILVYAPVVNQVRAEPEELDPDLCLLRLYRAADGKLQRTLDLEDRMVKSAESFANGELLLLGTLQADPKSGTSRSGARLELWEWASGRRIAAWTAPFFGAPAAVAPHGEFAVQPLAGNGFEVIDPYLGSKPVLQFELPAKVESFQFSPDGSRLAVALADTTMAIYDCNGWSAEFRRLAPGVSADPAALWEALADVPEKAYPAARRLSLLGDAAVDFLKVKLPPAPAADKAKIDRWIRDLNADRYAVRERASRELAALGPIAADALQKTLANKPDPEVKGRVEKLMDGLNAEQFEPATLRELRAVSVLFWIDTAAAKKLLESWAGGDPRAPLTKKARAALGK